MKLLKLQLRQKVLDIFFQHETYFCCVLLYTAIVTVIRKAEIDSKSCRNKFFYYGKTWNGKKRSNACVKFLATWIFRHFFLSWKINVVMVKIADSKKVLPFQVLLLSCMWWFLECYLSADKRNIHKHQMHIEFIFWGD